MSVWRQPGDDGPYSIGDLRMTKDGIGGYWVQMWDEIANSEPVWAGWHDIVGPISNPLDAKQAALDAIKSGWRTHVSAP